MEEVIGLVGRRLNTQPRGSPCVDLEDPQVCLQFSAIRLDFASFAKADRHPHAGALECDATVRPLTWVVPRVRECIADSTWDHAGQIDMLVAVFPETLQRMG